MKNALVWVFSVLAACAPEVREGIYGCDSDADCPRRQSCSFEDNLCHFEKVVTRETGSASASMLVCGGTRCEPSPDAVATCDQSRCMQYEPSVGETSALAAHGGSGGSLPLMLLCPEAQILVGAAFTTDKQSSTLVKVEPRCAPLQLVQSSTGEILADHGELPDSRATVDSSEVERTVHDCEPETAVTAIGGFVKDIQFEDGQTVTVVAQLALGCSRLTFGPRGRLMSKLTDVLESAAATENFAEECPKGQAAVGLRGAGDNLIGSLQMLCAPIVSYVSSDPDTTD